MFAYKCVYAFFLVEFFFHHVIVNKWTGSSTISKKKYYNNNSNKFRWWTQFYEIYDRLIIIWIVKSMWNILTPFDCAPHDSREHMQIDSTIIAQFGCLFEFIGLSNCR